MVRSLNFPLEDADYESLASRKEAVTKALKKQRAIPWREFVLLMKAVPQGQLVEAARKLGLDSEE